MDRIFFVHQPINMLLKWNAKKLHNVNKKLGEMTKDFKGFRNSKKVITYTFSRKFQSTTKELNLKNFETSF